MKLFCDSGAYSAWANDTKIDLQEYIDFIKLNKSQLEVYACLDDITNPEMTWKNQKEMERQGLNPLPVYHVGEDKKFLHKAMQYDYFAIGGMALSSGVARSVYFDDVFEKICTRKNDYYPTHKIHGFGLASPSLLVKYPWYSADTTSWMMYGKYGIIIIPKFKNGKFHYHIAPYILTVSSRSKGIGKEEHFQNLPLMEKEWVIDYCANKGFAMGKTLLKEVDVDYELKENEIWLNKKAIKVIHPLDRTESDKEKRIVHIVIKDGLCCNGELRDKLNLEYFLDLEKNQDKWPWQYKHSSEPIFD